MKKQTALLLVSFFVMGAAFADSFVSNGDARTDIKVTLAKQQSSGHCVYADQKIKPGDTITIPSIGITQACITSEGAPKFVTLAPAETSSSDASNKQNSLSPQSKEKFFNNDFAFQDAVAKGKLQPITDATKTEYDIGKELRRAFRQWSAEPTESNRLVFITALGNDAGRKLEITKVNEIISASK